MVLQINKTAPDYFSEETFHPPSRLLLRRKGKSRSSSLLDHATQPALAHDREESQGHEHTVGEEEKEAPESTLSLRLVGA